MSLVATHPERTRLRVQLRENIVLKQMSASAMVELEPLLSVADRAKGECLIRQGAHEMEQYFLLDGILKRVVANPQGKSMILRFTDAGGLETSYAAWRLNTPVPYSIVTVTKARVAKLPLPQWAAFLDQHTDVKQLFELEVMRLMSEIMAHTITLHLLDAPGRVNRFMRKHPELSDRVPRKELAAYLNLSAETLSRLRYRGKI